MSFSAFSRISKVLPAEAIPVVSCVITALGVATWVGTRTLFTHPEVVVNKKTTFDFMKTDKPEYAKWIDSISAHSVPVQKL